MPPGLRRREPPTRLSHDLGMGEGERPADDAASAAGGGGVAKGDLRGSSSPLGHCIKWQECSMSAGSTPLGSCSYVDMPMLTPRLRRREKNPVGPEKGRCWVGGGVVGSTCAWLVSDWSCSFRCAV